MTQQEQFHDTGYVPGPRNGEHDERDERDEDVAVGTAHADHEEPEDDDAAERYPTGTYASGSTDADLDEQDATVVDRDEVLAEDEREDKRVDEQDEVETAQAEEAEDTQWAAAHDDLDRTVGITPESDVVEEHEEADVVDEPVAADEPVADETVVEQNNSLPGAVDVGAVGALWSDGAVDGLKERWRELQLRFIDDPRAVAGEADQLIGEAVDTITGSLQAQRQQLADWQSGPGDDTERLRAAVRGYRDFLDRLLGM